MPRKPRLHVPGGLYHVILRGNNRQTIFFDHDDRRRWELLIETGLERHAHRIHAYCWMTNHVHMAIQCHEHPLSDFVSFIASQYARSTNKKMKRTGHLFERRHRAILVQADSYLKELVRYIHLNPIRARMLNTIAGYPWCSHRAYIGGIRPKWLTLDWVLFAFGTSPEDARRNYADFMQADSQTSEWEKFRVGSEDDHRILGDDGYIASIDHRGTQQSSLQTLEELVRDICQMHDTSEAALKSYSRNRNHSAIRAEIGLTAIENGVASNAEIARYFNRSQSSLSRAINRMRIQRKKVIK